MDSPADEPISIESFLFALQTSLKNSKCINVWAGYAEALFIGFSANEHEQERTEQEIPYEIHTHFSDWLIEINSVIVTSASGSRKKVTSTIKTLVGERVSEWRYNTINYNLEIEFENGWTLKIIPFKIEGLSIDQQDSDAWVIQMPGHTYYSVACNGKMTVQKPRFKD